MGVTKTVKYTICICMLFLLIIHTFVLNMVITNLRKSWEIVLLSSTT